MKAGLALACFLMSAAVRVGATECLRYDTNVTLTGTLKRMTFPGPPNFESVKDGDTPETGFYLELPAPICAAGKADDDPGHQPRENLLLVQLVLEQRQFDQFRPLLDKKVEVGGQLFSSHTGHHYAPLLIEKVKARAAR